MSTPERVLVPQSFIDSLPSSHITTWRSRETKWSDSEIRRYGVRPLGDCSLHGWPFQAN